MIRELQPYAGKRARVAKFFKGQKPYSFKDLKKGKDVVINVLDNKKKPKPEQN